MKYGSWRPAVLCFDDTNMNYISLTTDVITKTKLYKLLGLFMEHKAEILPNSHQQQQSEAETKWPPFCKQHFQIDFLESNFLIPIKNFIEICFRGPIYNNKASFQIMA